MKRLFFPTLLLPLAGLALLHRPPAFSPSIVTTHLADVRTGEWPMNLERDIDRRDTSYSLIFRDQQVEAAVVMDTLVFSDRSQIKYFGQALSVLKTGHNGDIANFKDYTLKRADKRFDGIWYILRIKFGLTDFQQPEADIMCKTIKGL